MKNKNERPAILLHNSEIILRNFILKYVEGYKRAYNADEKRVQLISDTLKESIDKIMINPKLKNSAMADHKNKAVVVKSKMYLVDEIIIHEMDHFLPKEYSYYLTIMEGMAEKRNIDIVRHKNNTYDVPVKIIQFICGIVGDNLMNDDYEDPYKYCRDPNIVFNSQFNINENFYYEKLMRAAEPFVYETADGAEYKSKLKTLRKTKNELLCKRRHASTLFGKYYYKKRIKMVESSIENVTIRLLGLFDKVCKNLVAAHKSKEDKEKLLTKFAKIKASYDYSTSGDGYPSRKIRRIFDGYYKQLRNELSKLNKVNSFDRSVYGNR